MAEVLAPGRTLSDRAGDVVVIVLVAPTIGGRLEYDGVEMVPSSPLPCGVPPRRPIAGPAVRAGQRYHDARSGLEVRCLQGAPGRLTIDGHPMVAQRATA